MCMFVVLMLPAFFFFFNYSATPQISPPLFRGRVQMVKETAPPLVSAPPAHKGGGDLTKNSFVMVFSRSLIHISKPTRPY